MSAMPSELTQIVGIGEVSGNFRCSQPQSAAFARAFTRQQPLRAPVGPLWDFWYLCWVGAYIERISAEIADIILREGIDYTQTKAVFKAAREKAGLHAPKEKRTAAKHVKS